MGFLLSEVQCKEVHDPYYLMNTNNNNVSSRKYVYTPEAVIVGAGPSGLATAACLKSRGFLDVVVLERSHCIASLWQLKTYDRLCLHLPKQFCELPLMPFPLDFPTYPTKQQFIRYLQDYAKKFNINPHFSHSVVGAEFDQNIGLWRVRTTTTTTTGFKGEKGSVVIEYACRWLIVATGENAEAVVPQIEGIGEFGGKIMHTSLYKSGKEFKGKKVLVIGCGNSGMEVCLDLCNHNASPSLVVRDTVHVLPQEMLGRSTFGVSMCLLRWLPMRIVDSFLLIVSWLMLGDTAKLGLRRPLVGPLELKNLSGKTPVLDRGTLAMIKDGLIKVRPAVRILTRNEVEFVDGRKEKCDAIIFATGYKSNVPSWLEDKKMFSGRDGLPKGINNWKGEDGLYAVGFTKRGLLGASMDAIRIAQDIERCWIGESKHLTFLPL